jgi:two-component system osmolarity sensor histidine kinase EnvZ
MMKKKRKAWSLQVQVFWLLFAVLFVSFSVTFTLLRTLVVQPGAAQIADMVVAEVHLLQQLSELDDEYDIIGLAHKAGIEVEEKPPAETYPTLGFYKRFRSELHRKLAFPTVSMSMGQGRVWLFLPDRGGLWFGFPFPDYISKTLRWLILSLSFSLFSGGLLAWFYAHYLRRSLRPIPQTIEDLGVGCSTPRIPETGPQEVRTLLQAVNNTAEHACKLAQDRQLMMVGISHDLRGPISRIRVAAEMLVQDDLKQAMVEDLGEMDDILEGFFQLVAGTDNLPWSDVDITDLLQAFARRQKRQAQLIELHLPQEPVFMYLPVTAFERVVDNLVRNAWKHGKPPVEVHLLSGPDTVELRIEDRGKGIAENERERLLKPFQQGQAARTVGGAGLGLAIACRLIELMHGRLELSQRSQGQGLVVRIMLPKNEPNQ